MYRGQPISEIKALDYHEFRWWNEVHRMMSQAEENATRKAKKLPEISYSPEPVPSRDTIAAYVDEVIGGTA